MRFLLFLVLAATAAAQSSGPLAAMLERCEQFGDDDARTQESYRGAIRSVVQGAWTRERDVLATALKHPRPQVRRCAASIFSLIGQGGYGTIERLGPVLPALFEALRDQEKEVGFGAAMAIAHLKPEPPPTVAQSIVQWLPHVDAGLQGILLTGLARVADPTPAIVAEFVRAIRTNVSPGTQSGALAGLTENRWKHPELMEPVVLALESPDMLSRGAATKVVARFGPAAGAALPRLRANLKTPDLLPVERADIHAAIAAISTGGRPGR